MSTVMDDYRIPADWRGSMVNLALAGHGVLLERC